MRLRAPRSWCRAACQSANASREKFVLPIVGLQLIVVTVANDISLSIYRQALRPALRISRSGQPTSRATRVLTPDRSRSATSRVRRISDDVNATHEREVDLKTAPL